MELIGSMFLILALALVVGLFITRPFLSGERADGGSQALSEAQEREHLRSSLMAERDRVLTALQDLDFDYALGKVPAEDYPIQRGALMKTGADVLRRLDTLEIEDGVAAGVPNAARTSRVEDRIEAAIAARRADASHQADRERQPSAGPARAAAGSDGHTNGSGARGDSLEELIATRKRQRQESSAGFCPRCGKPVQKSDKFCSRCGEKL